MPVDVEVGDVAGAPGRPAFRRQEHAEGTEAPRYESNLKAEKAGGDEYRIYGQVSQKEVGKDFRTLVPIHIEFGKGEIVALGKVGLTGEATVPIDIKVKLPKAPKRVTVNALGEVLARD